MAIFDRFIRYEWAECALELAVKQESPQALQEWLLKQGLAKESASRTRNILTHLWFDLNPSLNALRTDALMLYLSVVASDRIALHWGMAITQFPVFRETSRVVGRLGKLQEEFSKKEIIDRVLEKHSNQTTMRRAVQRVIQTMQNWSVIHLAPKSSYRLAPLHTIQSRTLTEWLFRALMIGYPEKYWLLPDVLGNTDLFPFDLARHSGILYKSENFVIERDSSGIEVVGIRPKEGIHSNPTI